MRKNLNLPPNIVDAISNFRHAGRYKSETAAVVDLLDRSTSDISHLNGYVYLATNSDESLFKIGFSANPKYRQKNLTCPKDGPAKILCFVRGGGRLMDGSGWCFPMKCVHSFAKGLCLASEHLVIPNIASISKMLTSRHTWSTTSKITSYFCRCIMNGFATRRLGMLARS